MRNDLDLPLELVWVKRPKRLPTVLTKEAVQQVIAQLTGVHRLIVQLLYGSGLRLMECMRMRVKDLGFGQRQILVRDAKGRKDRCWARCAAVRRTSRDVRKTSGHGR